jgi:hypothetical protein
MKVCTLCGEEKTLEEFPVKKNGKLGRHSHCRECFNENRRKYDSDYRERKREKYQQDPGYREHVLSQAKRSYEKNKEDRLFRVRTYRSDIRKRVIEKYGAKCCCCGESEFDFLTVDHVNNDGYTDRKTNGGTSGVYRMLDKMEGIVPVYQVLCYNCNLSRAFYGTCPHQRP